MVKARKASWKSLSRKSFKHHSSDLSVAVEDLRSEVSYKSLSSRTIVLISLSRYGRLEKKILKKDSTAISFGRKENGKVLDPMLTHLYFYMKLYDLNWTINFFCSCPIRSSQLIEPAVLLRIGGDTMVILNWTHDTLGTRS